MAKNKLILKEITAVALCKQGCNPAADIKLYKSIPIKKEVPVMNFAEFLKSQTPEIQTVINDEIAKACKKATDDAEDKMDGAMTAAMADPSKVAKEANKTVLAVAKALVDAATELEAVKKTVPVVNPDEEILKNLPEPVRKMIEDSNKRAAEAEKIAKQFADEKIVKKYEDAAAIYKSIPGEKADLALVMKALATSDPAAYAKLETILSVVNKGIEEGSLFKEMGNKGNGFKKSVGTATAALNVAAEEIKKSIPSLTKEQAFAKAMVANPELYKQYLQEMTDSEQE